VILYLNEDWRRDDGGLLRFWPEENAEALDIVPVGGTLVTFLSDRFWHEVLPARRERLSLTGWFRRR
jgi:SM-20-related protein